MQNRENGKKREESRQPTEKMRLENLGDMLDSILVKDKKDRPEGLPLTIGPYRILDTLGEGGMGAVFLAEQSEPVKRKVALKIIKPGMDNREVLARFESERQALALLSHPNIAQILDAGATENGQPYFAMEYVDGIPIDAYCNQHRLDLEERVELVTQICHGLQHAHERGILHRDIKPSNILVTTLTGDKRLTKIIDFGIAKALLGKLTEKTLHTQLDRMIGTPHYMSPEQTRPGAMALDGRSDVYSIGVLQYQLLSGSLPFDYREGEASDYVHLLGDIRDKDPVPPSTQITKARNAEELARDRSFEDSNALSRRLRGDLDWVTMRTLEKDRKRRYDTPMELAADLDRWMRKEPVLAGPPGFGTRMRKMLRRRRVLVSTVTAATIMLLLGFVLGKTLFDPEMDGESGTEAAIAPGPVTPEEKPAQSSTPKPSVRFRASATVCRVQPRDNKDPLRTPLRVWDGITEGQYIGVELDVDREAWVYFFGEDELGDQIRLFPGPGVKMQNPVQPGEHVLPTRTGGWPIKNDGGGAEHFLLVIGDQPVDFAEELAQKIKPALLSKKARRSLTRSAGAAVEFAPAPDSDTQPLLSSQVQSLEKGIIEVTEDALVRAFHLRNDTK